MGFDAARIVARSSTADQLRRNEFPAPGLFGIVLAPMHGKDPSCTGRGD